ncbi:MAG: hypothetical protein K1X92_05665 [Bacteroidia bacterium]|nr:hypothetical protein [Bacteroidia bacterium]
MEGFVVKFKKISRIIGVTVLTLFLITYLIYLIRPETFAQLGIDIKALAKYTFWFFIIKGTITTSMILYGIWAVRRKIKEGKHQGS